MPPHPPNILVVAGETSGDLHGSLLVRELARLNPKIEFFGIGGDRMERAGVALMEHVDTMAVVGFTEPLRRYPHLRRVFRRLNDAVREGRPVRAILIDYPGFNLRLARKLKTEGIPVTYYICPQLWAWREKRIDVMKECVDQVLCILPFEEAWYHERGIEATYVGHPLADRPEPEMNREGFIQIYGLEPGCPTVALFPGSRQQEVARHLPVMTRTVRLLGRRGRDVQTVVGQAPGVDLSSYDLSEAVVVTDTPQLALRYADVGIVASGTATLEAALYETPSVVIYRMSRLTWLLARTVANVPFVSLTNLIAHREVLPELLQDEATPHRIAERIEAIMESSSHREEIVGGLREVRRKLGGPGATKRAAQLISETPSLV